LGRYRQFLEDSGYLFGCPVGSLALELRDPEPEVREALAANFRNWAAHVEVCFQAAVDRFQPGTDARELAIFTLTTMEGGVMLARTFRSIEPFDTSVRSLRRYIRGLLRDPSSCPEV